MTDARELAEQVARTHYTGELQALEYAIESAILADREQRGGWVRVEERLPEDKNEHGWSRVYWVHCPRRGCTVTPAFLAHPEKKWVEYGDTRGNYLGECGTDGELREAATHWYSAPEPAPPATEKDGDE